MSPIELSWTANNLYCLSQVLASVLRVLKNCAIHVFLSLEQGHNGCCEKGAEKKLKAQQA